MSSDWATKKAAEILRRVADADFGISTPRITIGQLAKELDLVADEARLSYGYKSNPISGLELLAELEENIRSVTKGYVTFGPRDAVAPQYFDIKDLEQLRKLGANIGAQVKICIYLIPEGD